MLYLRSDTGNSSRGTGSATPDLGSSGRPSQIAGREVPGLASFPAWSLLVALLSASTCTLFKPTPLPSVASITTETTPPLPIRRLTPDEIASRRERGLCFNCDEKFHRGHRCASKIFLLIADEEDDFALGTPLLDPITDPMVTPDPAQTHITLHTLSGHLALETLHVLGLIDTHQVTILIDRGSTHNFIQEALVGVLGLRTEPTTPLRVMVGNDHQL